MTSINTVKMVVCGVSLVSLSAILPAPASAQPLTCSGIGSSGAACIQFDPGHQEKREDFFGNHSFKVIVDVTKKFFLLVDADTFPPGSLSEPTARYPDPAEQCIPYVGATSDTALGQCALYNVQALDGETGDPIPPEDEDEYFSGQIHYRIAWNFPTLASAFNNPRFLRAQDSSSLFFDITDGVFPTLQSGQDPAVDSAADGFSQHIVVHQPHEDRLAGCQSPLNCSDPLNPNANVFKAGQTVPVKVVLNPLEKSADLRLTYTGPDGAFRLADAAGNSNDGNMFRRTGNSFLFNWKTPSIPGVYQLTISPGTNSGDLFAPTTIMVTLR